jgi:hypothetical protein
MGLFKKIDKTEDPRQAHQLWTQLRDALVLHEKLEETHFYPPLKEVARTEDLVLEGYAEHDSMDLQIAEIDGTDPNHELWHPRVKVLSETVEHHAEEEEEGKLFPKVRRLWKKEQREEIGARMQQMMGEQGQARRAA